MKKEKKADSDNEVTDGEAKETKAKKLGGLFRLGGLLNDSWGLSGGLLGRDGGSLLSGVSLGLGLSGSNLLLVCSGCRMKCDWETYRGV
jgi:hypothetical protein